jgi:hypothetical protein
MTLVYQSVFPEHLSNAQVTSVIVMIVILGRMDAQVRVVVYVPEATMMEAMTIPMGCVLVVALRQSAAPLIVIPVSVQIILVQLAVG